MGWRGERGTRGGEMRGGGNEGRGEEYMRHIVLVLLYSLSSPKTERQTTTQAAIFSIRTLLPGIRYWYSNLTWLLVKVVHRARARIIARTHRATPPTNITQERVKRRKLILNTIPCKHIEVFQQHRNYFLPARMLNIYFLLPNGDSP